MNAKTRRIHKETFTTVFTGLLINYPLNLLGLYVCIDLLEWTDTLTIGTTITSGGIGKKELSMKDTTPKYKFDLLFDANSIDLS